MLERHVLHTLCHRLLKQASKLTKHLKGDLVLPSPSLNSKVYLVTFLCLQWPWGQKWIGSLTLAHR